MKYRIFRKVTAAALAGCMIFTMAGCANKISAEETEEAAEAIVPEENTETFYVYPAYSHETDDPYYGAVCRIAMEEFGSNFEPEDIMLPVPNILREDDSDPEDIKIWGYYEIFNYALRGTTLMTQSYGAYPGLIHLKEENGSYALASLDMVKDGNLYDESAKEIFGVDDELLSAFQNIGEEKDKNLLDTINWYKEDTGIDIEAYEDFGWDPVSVETGEVIKVDYPDLAGTWKADGAEMNITDPADNSIYDVTISVEREDESPMEYTLSGQYEVSTNTLYYWEGWVTQDTEYVGSGASGYISIEEDGTLLWKNADTGESKSFEKA